MARSNLEAASVAESKHDLSRLERILMASRNEDLNLAALISAVEKDIWYMEQLESNPSVLRYVIYFLSLFRLIQKKCGKVKSRGSISC